MELKCVTFAVTKELEECLNRTFMELKLWQ